jgi:hypothetical protein
MKKAASFNATFLVFFAIATKDVASAFLLYLHAFLECGDCVVIKINLYYVNQIWGDFHRRKLKL